MLVNDILYTPFAALVGAWLTGRLSAGLTAGVAWLLTCWLLERLVLHLPLRVSLHVVFDLLGAVV
jgi:hypothetical protein